MNEPEAMDLKDFLSMVAKILELQDTKTEQGVLNTMAVCMFVHNHLLYDAEFYGQYELLGADHVTDEEGRCRRKAVYFALPPGLMDLPEVWTDGPKETINYETKSQTDKTKKRRSDDSPKKTSKKSE